MRVEENGLSEPGTGCSILHISRITTGVAMEVLFIGMALVFAVCLR